MIPTYNEPNVVDHILRACTRLDYEPYEVVVVDDSDDQVTLRLLERWKEHPRVKIVHRDHRTGWKGGALNEGLKHLDPRSEFVLVTRGCSFHLSTYAFDLSTPTSSSHAFEGARRAHPHGRHLRL